MDRSRVELGTSMERYRLLELGTSYASGVAGRIWAGLGAEVIKYEPLSGADLPRYAQMVSASPAQVPSPKFRFLHGGKKNFIADLGNPLGRSAIVKLARNCDAVITDGLPILPAELTSSRCRVLGQLQGTSTREHPEVNPGVQYAQSGYMHLHGLPDKKPLVVAGHQAEHVAGLHMGIGVAASLFRVRHDPRTTERVQLISLTVQEAMLNVHQITFPLLTHQQQVLGRSGNSRKDIFPLSFFRACDGWIAVAAPTESQWRSLCQATGNDEAANDPELASPLMRDRNQAVIRRWLEPWLRQRSRSEIREVLQLHRIPCEPVNTLDEVLDHPQLEHRGFFFRGSDGLKYPTLPFRISSLAWRQMSPSTAGEHTAQILRDIVGWSDRQIALARGSGAVL